MTPNPALFERISSYYFIALNVERENTVVELGEPVAGSSAAALTAINETTYVAAIASDYDDTLGKYNSTTEYEISSLFEVEEYQTPQNEDRNWQDWIYAGNPDINSASLPCSKDEVFVTSGTHGDFSIANFVDLEYGDELFSGAIAPDSPNIDFDALTIAQSSGTLGLNIQQVESNQATSCTTSSIENDEGETPEDLPLAVPTPFFDPTVELADKGTGDDPTLPPPAVGVVAVSPWVEIVIL